jgi:hypothetical protein
LSRRRARTGGPSPSGSDLGGYSSQKQQRGGHPRPATGSCRTRASAPAPSIGSDTLTAVGCPARHARLVRLRPELRALGPSGQARGAKSGWGHSAGRVAHSDCSTRRQEGRGWERERRVEHNNSMTPFRPCQTDGRQLTRGPRPAPLAPLAPPRHRSSATSSPPGR